MLWGMWTRERLVAHLEAGGTADYLLFWGHTPKKEGVTDASCLSQWFPASFEIDGTRYLTAEHWMMAEKARLFRDDEALAKILGSSSPAEAKAHGRTVHDFSDDAWAAARSAAVVAGNVAKFGQNEPLGAFLRSTRDRILVEASPRDAIWGIGMGASNPNARVPAGWRGSNLLGFALMEARARLFRSWLS
jgi:ribA/ribD-fused uncharacterized protein